MEPRSLKYVAAACGGEQLTGSPETLVERVCTDSRKAQAGDLFFAIQGDRFDGHDYINEAARKGVGAVVVARNRVPGSSQCPVVAVDSPRQALGRLAGSYRSDFTLPIIAVGGSNGKTTAKELIASVLRQCLQTLWSEASFNNDIGVPLTLLRLAKSDEVAVLEVGTNHPGELAPLVRMVQPTFGVITSIGREHLEFFGDVSGVAEEEGSLAELLPVNGTLLLNGDSEWAGPITRRTRATGVRVGLNDGNDWRARDVILNETGVRFQVDAPKSGYSGEYNMQLVGRHQALNALFAIGIGAELGLSRAQIQQGLAECPPGKMRMQLCDFNGVKVLNDAYNANADSVLAALQTLRDLPCAGRRVAVLGDMAELGVHTRAAHEEAGSNAAELGLDQLFAIGTMAGVTAGAARAAGMRAVREFANVNDAADEIKSFLRAGDAVLLKASRAMRLEQLAERLEAVKYGEN